jgi:hypothetical protein
MEEKKIVDARARAKKISRREIRENHNALWFPYKR